jgi:small subunit ribosomal protein S20
MPNTHSAKKALRKNLRRRVRNRSDRSALRTELKKFRVAAAGTGTDREAVTAAFRSAVKHLDQAAAKHLIHKNTAARLKSRLAKVMAKPKAAATP